MEAHTLDWSGVDPLGEALHALRMSGTFYCRSELTAPWGLKMPAFPECIWFHAVVRGECLLTGKGLETQHLRSGDFVLITRGQGHEVRSNARAPAPSVLDLPQEMVSDRYALLRHGGGGEGTTLICGIVRFEHHAARDLVERLPPILRIDALDPTHGDRVHGILRMMAEEARQLAAGGEAVLTRLADILVVQAVRAWLASRDPEQLDGWLGAFRDPRVGRALGVIHRDPTRDWDVAALGRVAGMSRSAFAARFAAVVGETPAHYVMRVRMQVARDQLRVPGTTAGEVAARLGYQSEAAFCRAFKRCTGITPGASRRQASAPDHG
jgi:AraC-like DNA-binding protein